MLAEWVEPDLHVHVRFRNTFVFKIFGMATKIDSALDFEFFRRSDSNKVHHVFNCNICNRSFVTRVTITCLSTVNSIFYQTEIDDSRNIYSF